MNVGRSVWAILVAAVYGNMFMAFCSEAAACTVYIQPVIDAMKHWNVCVYVVSEGKETEVTPWCLGVMANLCRNNLSLQMFVKGKVTQPLRANHFCFISASLKV